MFPYSDLGTDINSYKYVLRVYHKEKKDFLHPPAACIDMVK